MALVEMADAGRGAILQGFPPADSPLLIERFFDTLYLRYDERYVYAAPDLKKVTRRLEWSPASPIFSAGGLPSRAEFAIRTSIDAPSPSDGFR